MRLRQTANDPRLIKHNEPSAKTSAVFSHMESLIGTSHKVLLFSGRGTSHLSRPLQ